MTISMYRASVPIFQQMLPCLSAVLDKGAAFAAAAVSAVTGSAWLGLGAAILTGAALALLIGFACITHRGNQVVAGTAVTIMVVGLGPTLALAWFNLGGQTPQLDQTGQRFTALVWPWTSVAREHPVPGLLYAEVLGGRKSRG